MEGMQFVAAENLAVAEQNYKAEKGWTHAVLTVSDQATQAIAAAGAREAVNHSSDRNSADRVAQGISDRGGNAVAIGADVSRAAGLRSSEEARIPKRRAAANQQTDVRVASPGWPPMASPNSLRRRAPLTPPVEERHRILEEQAGQVQELYEAHDSWRLIQEGEAVSTSNPKPTRGEVWKVPRSRSGGRLWSPVPTPSENSR